MSNERFSEALAFVGPPLRRGRPGGRSADWIREPAARALVLVGGQLVWPEPAATTSPWCTPAQWQALPVDEAAVIVLGFTDDGAPQLVVPLRAGATVPAGWVVRSPLDLVRQQLLPPDLQGIFAPAASLAAWHERNRFCGHCGQPSESAAAGWHRACPSCGQVVFPRHDPVVIMLIIDAAGDRCLLGRTVHFPPRMYSALSGFVEAGESVEGAVRRESAEEAGLEIGRVEYRGSQPWPLPHSLMLGFRAEARTTDIRRDGDELEDCRWFTRAEVVALLARRESEGDAEHAPLPPPRGTIAYQLLRDWAEGAG